MTDPILPGFYPDPSICRVGDDYYLATSSFEYFPGAPVFHSTDLLTWTQLGHAFDRESQLRLEPGGASGGIFAPTLRHHDDRFWLITTNASQARAGHMILTAEDPAGPWSDPVFTDELDGIDPDLTWDEDGACHLTWSCYQPGLNGIAQVPIDPVTGRSLGAPRLIWGGTGLAWPESPHLYHVEDWWYLLIAEGGTERGHCISVARARTIDGPFEGAPHNPIFSHRSMNSPVQNAGHGDLVRTADGDWAMVYLAARPSGITPGFHVNGRETFLAGIDWVDGWPVVRESRYDVPSIDTSFIDDFSTTDPSPRWISPGPPISSWTSRGPDRGIRLAAAPGDGPDRRLLAVRIRDAAWTAEAVVDTSTGTGRMVLRLDDHHWCAVVAGEDAVVAELSIRPGTLEIGRASRPGTEAITLWMRATVPAPVHNAPVGPDVLELGFTTAGAHVSLGSFDGRYLSTEVAGGFTGRVVGVSPDSGTVELRSFSYRGDREPIGVSE
ncbi:family 43 glycosylhydrolase [Agromyces sp. MMS24-JH15]|uniref:glycoside hydrolase family 43 protein n=1 Tax=Agromyces sp. MMS24-JH15 TaxID=3243765 RepID=UPI003748F885